IRIGVIKRKRTIAGIASAVIFVLLVPVVAEAKFQRMAAECPCQVVKPIVVFIEIAVWSKSTQPTYSGIEVDVRNAGDRRRQRQIDGSGYVRRGRSSAVADWV